MVSEETIQAKKEQAEQEKLIKYMQGYFDTKRDEDGMMNFVKLMNLGEEETVVSFTKVTQGDDTFDESGDISDDSQTGADSDNASEDA